LEQNLYKKVSLKKIKLLKIEYQQLKFKLNNLFKKDWHKFNNVRDPNNTVYCLNLFSMMILKNFQNKIKLMPFKVLQEM
jgi:hypothetical protein